MQSTTANTTFPSGSPDSGSNGGQGSGGQGSIGKAANRAHAALDSAASTVDDAIKKAKPVINRVAESAHQAVDKAVGLAEPTAEWLNQKSENLKVTQEKLLSDAREYVSVNPLKAVVIAAVAGLLIGRLLR